MTTVRTAKQKGSQMEYSCYDSLKSIIPDIRLTKQLGFVGQYDLISDKEHIIIECKRHKGFSWNELYKYFIKVSEKAVDLSLSSKDNSGLRYIPYVVFQANRQPCLVMKRTMFIDKMIQGEKVLDKNTIVVVPFEDYFGTPFVEHGKKLSVIKFGKKMFSPSVEGIVEVQK